ncbi:uncharacterized protein [Apostichopus japonicus]|uniref:Np17 n=1 Tax=Stichopus japonicus TaxID=307972 RepID=A0A2Z4C1F8_STIJA|nr:np17 precursor [Apostichopus japonicus]
MEFGSKIMVLATSLLVCLIVASTQGELSQRRISRRDIDGGTALINDLDTNFGYPHDDGDDPVETMLRRTLLLKTYWQLCTELDACPEKVTKTEDVLPPRTSRGHLFWRTGILMPPSKGGK